jgi:hypothetical protein
MAELAGRQAGQLVALGFRPGEETAHGMGIGPPGVRVANASGEELLPDEGGSRAGSGDKGR